MATDKGQETLRLLVQHVSRAFYEPKHTIIMDQLVRHPAIEANELALRTGFQLKELNKIIAVLLSDSLVKVYCQNELKEGAQRSVGKQYYYIDYGHFRNIVKWRIIEMWNIIDQDSTKTTIKGYVCPQCKRSYLPLEVSHLTDPTTRELVCEVCKAEVVIMEDAEGEQGSEDRMERLNNQIRLIREGLQKSEAMVFPVFDIIAWIKSNKFKFNKNVDSVATGGADGGRKDDDVGVMMAMDKDEHTRRLERDAEAETKRQQNAMPTWHLKSTITGDFTALGVKETTSNVALKASDDIGGSLKTNGQNSNQVGLSALEENMIDVESDRYDQYYASLTTSGQPTPSVIDIDSSSFSSPNFSLSYSQLNDDDKYGDDEPNSEYLDSLNASRKRLRSQEVAGTNLKTKVAKVDGGLARDGDSSVNTYAEVHDIDMAIHKFAKIGATGDDPVLYVAGIQKPYSQIMDDDHELMTPEEYIVYFDVLKAQS